jgi:hypothetical protein
VNYIFDFTPNTNNETKYLDEPYEYHAKLLEVLAFATYGKDGLFYSEKRLRNVITLKYCVFLLSQPDEFSDSMHISIDQPSFMDE